MQQETDLFLEQRRKKMVDKKNNFTNKISNKFNIGNTFILFLILISLVIFFSFSSKDFFSLYNIQTMLSNLSFNGVIAICLTIVMISGEVDISVGGTVALISTVIAVLLEKGVEDWVVILIALFIGIIIGSINGFLVTVVGVNSLIATLGMMSVTRGIAYVITGGLTTQATSPILKFIRSSSFLKIPFPVIILILMVGICVFLMNFSKWGRKVYAVGANPTASYLSGINVKRVKFTSFVLLGFATAIGGIILTSLSIVGMGQHGLGLELVAISAVLLGGTALSGGKGTIFGTLAGVFIINTLYNGMTILNVYYFYVQIVQGAILIAVVAAYEVREKRRILK
jgi:ribose/xylose/arabinose/galactoside ABC-type transport system permease subunit